MPRDGERRWSRHRGADHPLDLLCASRHLVLRRRRRSRTCPACRASACHRRRRGRRSGSPPSAGMRPGDGSLAERCVGRRRDVVPLAGTAWTTLRRRARPLRRGRLDGADLAGRRCEPGEQVLVLGAGGAVGQAAIRVAARARRRPGGRGLPVGRPRTRAAPQRRRRGRAAARRERRRRAGRRLRGRCGGPVDLVLDPLFGVPAAAARATLRRGGRLVNLGSAAGETAPSRRRRCAAGRSASSATPTTS